MKFSRKTGMRDEGAAPPSEDDPAPAPSIAPRKASNGKPQGKPGAASGVGWAAPAIAWDGFPARNWLIWLGDCRGHERTGPQGPIDARAFPRSRREREGVRVLASFSEHD